jgi:ankyrin repeat protein
MKNRFFLFILIFSLTTFGLQAVSVGELVKTEPRRVKVKKGWVPGVNVLDLSGMKLDSLKGLEDIPGIESVTRLYLDNNNIHTIESGDFAPAIKLRALGLSHNGLGTVEPNAFAGLKNLKVLDLSNNALEIIPQEGLNGMPGLRFLSMSKNPMINPKGNLQAQVPKAFITTLPITKENIKKWGAVVGVGVAALITAVSAVVSVKIAQKSKQRAANRLYSEWLEEDAQRVFQGLDDAIFNCNKGEVKRLLEEEVADPKILEASNAQGFTLLGVAMSSGCIKDGAPDNEARMVMVKALVEKNNNLVHIKVIDDKSALHTAMQQGNATLMEYLISKGAAVDDTDREGKTALFYATGPHDGGLDAFNALLVGGADVNKTDAEGNTVLHDLAKDVTAQRNVELVRKLLEQSNIDQDMRNNQGKTALDLAKENPSGGEAIVRVIQPYGEISEVDPMAQCGERSDVNAVEQLV